MKPTKIKISFFKGKITILDARLSFLIWTCVTLIFPVVALIKELVLPRYFFVDANTIRNFMLRNTPITVGDSYASTAAFYNVFDVARDSFIFPLLSSIMIIMFFFQVLKRANPKSITLLEFGTMLYYMMLAIVYMSLLSKDFIVMLMLMPFLFFSSKGFWGLFVWSLIVLFYAVYFRSYWFLVIALFWGLYILLSFVRSIKLIITFVFVSLFLLAIIFNLTLGVDIDNFRTIINDARIEYGEQDAKTMITNIIPGGGFVLGWINSCITWLFLMVPIPLLLFLSPYYILISFFLVFIYYKFWRAIKYFLNNKNQLVLKAVICLIISYTVIQSIFEPDYGSYVRHLAPFYPLFFYAIFSINFLSNTDDAGDDVSENFTLR